MFYSSTCYQVFLSVCYCINTFDVLLSHLVFPPQLSQIFLNIHHHFRVDASSDAFLTDGDGKVDNALINAAVLF